jgi:hypothetical protein
MEAIEEDRPPLDAHDRKRPVLQPRIGPEPVPDRVRARCADDEQYLAIALQRATEQDEPRLDQPVHEPGMVIETRLLPEAARPVPRTASPFPDRVQLHTPNLTTWPDKPGPTGTLWPLDISTRHGSWVALA